MMKPIPTSLNSAIKVKIAGGKYDRRRRLTNEQKDHIRLLYFTTSVSYAVLAKEFGVSTSAIEFTIHPDKNIRKHQYGYSREEKTKMNRETRNYKHKLLLEGKI